MMISPKPKIPDPEAGKPLIKISSGRVASSVRRRLYAGQLIGAQKISGSWLLRDHQGRRISTATAAASPRWYWKNGAYIPFGSFEPPSDIDKSEVIGTDEAAALLGTSRRRIQQLCQEGALKAEKVGGVWLIQVKNREKEI